MSNTYTNPLDNKAVALIGSFKSFKTAYAMQVLEQMDAITQNNVIRSTDIVIVGSNPGKKLDKVIKLDIEQWDETQLTQAFADYNAHLQTQPDASSFDPLVPAFQYEDEFSYTPKQLYGLPLAHQIHQQILGKQYAYVVNIDENADIWNYPGVDTLQALIIEEAKDDTWATFAKQLHRLPKLKALVINSVCFTKQTIDADQLLTALPQLESLYLTSHRFMVSGGIAFNVARHSNLQQLYINATVVEDLPLISLPQLRLLHVEQSTLDAAIEGLNNKAYPRLNTLQLFDLEDCIALLIQLPAAPHITRLILSSNLWRTSLDDNDVENQLRQLATWKGTQQLSHLELVYISLPQLATLKHHDVPKLSHLNLRFFRHISDADTPQLELWEGLHITLSQAWFNGESMIESLINTLQALPPLASLTFTQQRSTFTSEQETMFDGLPYAVMFA